MKNVWLCGLLFMVNVNVIAQSDTVELSERIEFSSRSFVENPDSIKLLLRSYLSEAHQSNDSASISLVYYYWSLIDNYFGDEDNSSFRDILESVHWVNSDEGYMKVYPFYVKMLQKYQLYDSAVSVLLASQKLAQKVDNDYFAFVTQMQIGKNYFDRDLIREAYKSYRLAYIKNNKKFKEIHVISLFEMARCFFSLGNIDSADHWLNMALNSDGWRGVFGSDKIHYRIITLKGKIDLKKGNLKSVKHIIDESEQFIHLKEIDVIPFYNLLFSYYLKKEDYTRCEEIIDIAEDIKYSKNPQEYAEFIKNIVDYYILKNAHKEALEIYQDFIATRDELFARRREKQANAYAIMFDVASIKYHRDLLASDNLILERDKDAYQRGQVYLTTIILLLIIIVAAFSFGLMVVTKNKRKQEELNKIIEGNLKEKELLIQEVHHRVKNNFQIIYTFLVMESLQVKGDSTIADLIKRCQVPLLAMANVHEQLYNKDTLEAVDVKQFLGQVIPEILKGFNTGSKKLTSSQTIDDHIILNLQKAITIALLLQEAITNSMKHGFTTEENGHIHITLLKNEGHLIFEIADNGMGLKEDSINNKGMRLIRMFAKQLRAQLNISSDSGTIINLKIPVTNESE